MSIAHAIGYGIFAGLGALAVMGFVWSLEHHIDREVAEAMFWLAIIFGIGVTLVNL